MHETYYEELGQGVQSRNDITAIREGLPLRLDLSDSDVSIDTVRVDAYTDNISDEPEICSDETKRTGLLGQNVIVRSTVRLEFENGIGEK